MLPERFAVPVPSVGRWINWFTLSGVAGLKLPAGCARRWPLSISACYYVSW